MPPAYLTVGGERREITDLNLTVGGERKAVVEGWIAVGGERRQWFSRGQLLVGYNSNERLGDAQPPKRMAYDGTNIAYQTLTLAGDDYTGVQSALRVGRDTFFGFDSSNWYKFTVSGDTLTVAENTYPTGWGSFPVTYSFELNGSLYVGFTNMRRITPNANLDNFTFANLTRSGGVAIPNNSPGGGVLLGNRAFVIVEDISNSSSLELYEIAVSGDNFTPSKLTGPATDVTGSWETAVSDGRRIFIFDNLGTNVNRVAVVEVSGNTWSSSIVNDVPDLYNADWAVRV